MPNLNTVISRVYVHRRKELMDERQRKFGFPFNLGDLLSHTVHLRRLCEPCVFTHTCKRKKKTLAHFVPTHSSQTPLRLCTLSSTAVGGGRRSRSKRPRISSPSLSAAYLHRHSRLWSTGVFCGIGPGIFLMEKVINLISKIFTHLLSQSFRRC